jgi:GNAT superfamily N-acetyltransferase
MTTSVNTPTLERRVFTARSAGEQEQAIATLVRAFQADPAARWLFPDDSTYAADFSGFVRAFGGRAFEGRTAFHTGDSTGAALWFAPGVEPDGEAVVELVRRALPPGRWDDAFAFFAQMEHFHPTFPHWYLPLIGVEPAHQGNGVGSALLRHVLGSCDRSGAASYLEASSPASVPLYERHGFRVVGEIQGGGSPVVYPMLRRAGAR